MQAQKRVAVLGGGIVGVVTAWYLAQKGHSVTVIDRSDVVAGEASRANAGQLSYSFTDALARPDFLRKLPGILAGADPGILLRPCFDAAFLRWGSAFLLQCTAGRARDNTLAVLRLAMRSAALLETLMEAVPIRFDFVRAGKLVLLSGAADVEAARVSARLKKENGCGTEVLTRDAATRIEPALAEMRGDFIGATWSEKDYVADARMFATELAAWMSERENVRFCMQETVTELVAERGHLCKVLTDRGDHDVEAAVVCLGVGSSAFLRPFGIDPLVCPVRGYSITLPPGQHPPKASISDLRHRIVFSRLGDSIRIAGFADFVGDATRHDRQRTSQLLSIARQVAPRAAEYDIEDPLRWGGLRPMTPDGRPRVGPTRVSGLYLNTGHGMLGWTLACATGHALAEQIS